MKDKRTYNKLKEHGEDMSHENESKIDTSPIELLTEQYRSDLKQYQEREGLYIRTENQLRATKQIVVDMAGTVRELHTQNEGLKAEIARLNEEIQLLELQIKK
jgi:hypothetical protein|tara:strand:- start:398 stop:706 length:309 start_codon:yes stop_codon:yes gene_type:complete